MSDYTIEEMTLWTIKSFTTHFTTELSGFNVYFEGERRKTREQETFVELRYDGLFVNEGCNTTEYIIEVNFLIQIINDGQDIYAPHRISSRCLDACKYLMPIYKYGGDESLVDCFERMDSFRHGRTENRHYGQIEPRTQILQASAEAHYYLAL